MHKYFTIKQFCLEYIKHVFKIYKFLIEFGEVGSLSNLNLAVMLRSFCMCYSNHCTSKKSLITAEGNMNFSSEVITTSFEIWVSPWADKQSRYLFMCTQSETNKFSFKTTLFQQTIIVFFRLLQIYNLSYDCKLNSTLEE